MFSQVKRKTDRLDLKLLPCLYFFRESHPRPAPDDISGIKKLFPASLRPFAAITFRILTEIHDTKNFVLAATSALKNQPLGLVHHDCGDFFFETGYRRNFMPLMN